MKIILHVSTNYNKNKFNVSDEKNTYDLIEEYLCKDNSCDILLNDNNIYENHLLNNMKNIL